MHSRLLSRILLILSFSLAFFAAGCAHYQLGTSSKLAFRTIFIAPVESEALLPQARAIVGARIREDFLRDSRVELVASAEEADAVLVVKLRKYSREAAVAQTKDTGLARKFQLTLQAECDLTLKDGTTLFKKRAIEARRENYVDGGQLQSEYEMLPVLAAKLSEAVTHATLDTW